MPWTISNGTAECALPQMADGAISNTHQCNSTGCSGEGRCRGYERINNYVRPRPPSQRPDKQSGEYYGLTSRRWDTKGRQLVHRTEHYPNPWWRRQRQSPR